MTQKFCTQNLHKKAFTLAELLTAVLVISIIMVALAPVITKRMKDNVSVTTDNKKGLEIFTNPGTYTFEFPIGINTLFIQGAGGGGGGAGSTYVEKEKSFTSSTTWTVPVGVNEITLAITGAGGGGGGANGANSGRSKCDDPANEYLFIRIASDETDLCITRQNIVSSCNLETAGNTIISSGEMSTKSCTTGYCCWTPSGARTTCTKKAAEAICYSYRSGCNRYNLQGYRLFSASELKKMGAYRTSFSDMWEANKLNLCNGGDGDCGGAGN